MASAATAAMAHCRLIPERRMFTGPTPSTAGYTEIARAAQSLFYRAEIDKPHTLR
jgi:hypothetical protein